MTKAAKADYFGCKFYELAKIEQPIRATVSYGDKRILFEGTLSIDQTEGSYAYGPELQIHLWATDQPQEQTRAFNKGYARIEICMPIGEGLSLLHDSFVQFYEAPKKNVNAKPLEKIADFL